MDAAVSSAEAANDLAKAAEERAKAADERAKAAQQKMRRDLLAMPARQAEQRFGAHAAGRLGTLLQRISSMEAIAEAGDQVAQAATADELLSGVKGLVDSWATARPGTGARSALQAQV